MKYFERIEFSGTVGNYLKAIIHFSRIHVSIRMLTEYAKV